MIMQVHDELIFEVDDADIERLIDGVVQRMEAAASLDVVVGGRRRSRLATGTRRTELDQATCAASTRR